MASLIRMGFRYKGRHFEPIAAGGVALRSDLIKSKAQALPIVKREVDLYMRGVVKAMDKRHSRPWIPDERGPIGVTRGRLYKRRGGIAVALEEGTEVTGSSLDSVKGSIKMSPISAIHEHGGIVRVRRAKWLTIPLPAALDERGVPIEERARDWDDTFIIRSRKGNLLIVQRDEDTGEIVPLYVLKKAVEIPERLGLAHTMRLGLKVLRNRIELKLSENLRQNLGLKKETATREEEYELA